MRFGKRGNVSRCIIGPYKIFRRVERVTYALEVHSGLESVNLVFHVVLL